MTSYGTPAAPPVRRLVVQGKVQGVGFRWFVRERARRLGVAGWVRNEHDGTVQVFVGGPVSLVARFLDELHIGPPGAVIESIREVELIESDGASTPDGSKASPALPYPFEIRR